MVEPLARQRLQHGGVRPMMVSDKDQRRRLSSVSLTPHEITTSADSARSVFAIDVDGDGDIDVLSASFNDDTIAWYESDGASPPSWTTHTVTTSANGARSVFAIDVDNDGDIDLCSASSNDDTIAW